MLAGLGITYVGTIQLYEAMTSVSWPTCEGVITHSEVVPPRHAGAGQPNEVSIRYDYTVEDKKYTGDRYRFAYTVTLNPNREVAGIVAAHPVGTVVKVYYSPSSPTTSVLVPGTNWAVYFLLGTGVVFFLVGVWVVYGGVRSVW